MRSNKLGATIVWLLTTTSVSAFAAAADGMITFPAGSTLIGSNQGARDEQPQFSMEIESFKLDRTPVTVDAFSEFVDDAGYVTDADKFTDAAVMQFGTGRWLLVSGANWQWPQGPEAKEASPDHPVTQVSWRDAVAYCDWKNKRLPTEFEWEYAARFGQSEDPRYAFGDEYLHEGDYLANIWSGLFPVVNDGDDGFLYTSPVGHFGTTPAGLTDMAGNVWEWTSSVYRPYYERHNPEFENVAEEVMELVERVQRGGSYLCDPKFCHGFRVSARSHSTPDSSLMHVGFRCAMSRE